jgi:hypothetical protein
LRPHHVDALTIANSTGYELLVEVQSGDGGWVPVMVAGPHRDVVTRAVIDQGDRWIFRVRGQGATADPFELHRDDLERGGWRVPIDVRIEAQLRAQGAPLPPEH